MKSIVMALFALFSSFSILPTAGASAEAAESACSVMKWSLSPLDTRDIEKCYDLQTQNAKLFVNDGKGWDIGGCLLARSRSAAKSLNACRQDAVADGRNANSCTQLVNFQTSDGYHCSYTAIHYLKDERAAFIGFTLDRETQQSLYREAQSRSLSVRELIAEKLKK